MSVDVDVALLDTSDLPHELVVSALTLAELATSPHATTDPNERARRQDRLQRTEAAFDPLPFDADAARAYGRLHAAMASTGRTARGTCAVDLLIAASAGASELPVSTRHVDDFHGLDGIVDVIGV